MDRRETFAIRQGTDQDKIILIRDTKIVNVIYINKTIQGRCWSQSTIHDTNDVILTVYCRILDIANTDLKLFDFPIFLI